MRDALRKIHSLPHAPTDLTSPAGAFNCDDGMKEYSPWNQVMMAVKASSGLQRVLQAVQGVVQGGCRSARGLLCLPLHAAVCTCPAPNHQQREDKTTQVALLNPASTILIVNISNSTLIDCVIGSDACPATVTESQPLMREPELHMHDQMRCSCSHGQQGAADTSTPPPPPPPPPLPPPLHHLCPLPPDEPAGINIHSSHLNCVIIGDNNYMHAELPHGCEALDALS